MENFNKGFAPSSKDAGGNKSNNENEMNPEMSHRLKSPCKKQLPTKNFMNPTISASIKATAVPRKKILGERNQTVDTVEQTSFGSKSVRSCVVDSGDDVEKDVVISKPCLQPPYDPVKNYLSPRPKFLRYDPDRRRKMLKENYEDRVVISNGIPSPGLQLGSGSSGLSDSDSCSQQECEEKGHVVNDEESEDENGEECEGESEDDEEEVVEFGEDRCCSLMGCLKFLFVVIALILTTQAICSMNSPVPSQTMESVCSVNDWRTHVYGFNFSEVGYGLVREPDLLVGRLKESDVYGRKDMSETIEEVVVVQNEKNDDSNAMENEAENDDSNVIDNEFEDDNLSVIKNEAEKGDSNIIENEVGNDNLNAIENEAENDDSNVIENEVENDNLNVVENEAENNDLNVIQEETWQEHEVKASEVMEIHYVEAETETVDDYVDAEFENVNDMEDGMEKEFGDIKADYMLIKFTSFDLTSAILIAHILVLTSFIVIHCSKGKRSSTSPVTTPVEEKEFEDLEPSTDPQPMIQHKDEELFVTSPASILAPQLQNDIKKVHIPSVELLGELVFGEEITSNISTENDSSKINSSIQTTAVSVSQTGDSNSTAKIKQRRKNTEVVTPSPVRRSSRLKNRSVMSP